MFAEKRLMFYSTTNTFFILSFERFNRTKVLRMGGGVVGREGGGLGHLRNTCEYDFVINIY